MASIKPRVSADADGEDRIYLVLVEPSYPLREKSVSPLWGLMGALLVLFLMFLADRYVGTAFSSLWTVAGVLLVIIGILLTKKALGRAEPAPSIAMSTDYDASGARLIARANHAVLSTLADIRAVAFEPVIVSVQTSNERIWISMLIGFGFSCPAFILLPPAYSIYGGAAMYAAAPLAYWIWARFRPTYYRIVPGRLDVMVGSFFGNSVHVAKRIDLRAAKVTLQGKRGDLSIELPGEPPMDFDFDRTSEPRAFVKAVFRGALCKSPAPPLPDGALLG